MQDDNCSRRGVGLDADKVCLVAKCADLRGRVEGSNKFECGLRKGRERWAGYRPGPEGKATARGRDVIGRHRHLRPATLPVRQRVIRGITRVYAKLTER